MFVFFETWALCILSILFTLCGSKLSNCRRDWIQRGEEARDQSSLRIQSPILVCVFELGEVLLLKTWDPKSAASPKEMQIELRADLPLLTENMVTGDLACYSSKI